MTDEIKKEDLEREIEKILKVSDLQKISMKNLRQQLEKEMGVELKSWASTISKIAMEYVDKMEEEREKKEEEQEKKEEDLFPSGSESEEEAEKQVKKPTTRGRKRKTSGDSDYVEEKPKKVGRKKKSDEDGEKPKGRATGYTRAYRLSPALSELMGGADSMPRHEVVKRVWAMIKEKELYDPKNKQFAICDDALYKVIGTKRFRTFGMMKYLKTHFLDD